MKRLYYTLILFSFLFVSCENDIIADAEAGMHKFSLISSKKTLLPGWSVGDIIGVTAYISDSEDVYSNHINRRYKITNNETFIPISKEDEILHPLADQSVDFIAYYPYKAGVSTLYPISLSEQSNQRLIDLLYSNNAKNKTNSSGNIEFVFDHVLSKIKINTSPSEGLVEKDLQGMRVIINNVHSEGIFNLTTGYIEILDSKSSIEMKTESNGCLSEAFVLPKSTSGVSFTIELANGNAYGADFPQGQQLKSGYIYTYNITISPTGITFNSIEIEDWITDGNIPQEEIADEVKYQTGDFYPNPGNPKTAVGIVYWLKPGTEGKEGKIVSYDTAVRNWGDSGNRNLYTSISTGTINWDIIKEEDPTFEKFPAFKWCMEKGEGWYLPSRYELYILQEVWLKNREYMDENIRSINGESFNPDDVYLASSESRSWPTDRAEIYSFSDKGWNPIYKNEEERIRAVKEF